MYSGVFFFFVVEFSIKEVYEYRQKSMHVKNRNIYFIRQLPSKHGLSTAATSPPHPSYSIFPSKSTLGHLLSTPQHQFAPTYDNPTPSDSKVPRPSNQRFPDPRDRVKVVKRAKGAYKPRKRSKQWNGSMACHTSFWDGPGKRMSQAAGEDEGLELVF